VCITVDQVHAPIRFSLDLFLVLTLHGCLKQDGDLPLHIASYMGHGYMCQVLLEVHPEAVLEKNKVSTKGVLKTLCFLLSVNPL